MPNEHHSNPNINHGNTLPVTVLMAALYGEITPTINLLRLTPHPHDQAFTGTANGQRIIAVVTGIGPPRAIDATHHILETHQPDRVILLGFAGGLDPRLTPATVLAITAAKEAHSPTIIFDADTQSADPDTTIFTTDRIADTVATKQELFTRHGCAAVDMETYPIANLLTQNRVPLKVLRAIIDPADMALPAESSQWVTPEGRTNAPAAVRYLATHPWQMKTLLHLQKTASLAAQRLAEETQTLIQLP